MLRCPASVFKIWMAVPLLASVVKNVLRPLWLLWPIPASAIFQQTWRYQTIHNEDGDSSCSFFRSSSLLVV